jgi:hypothetical protein
VIAAIAGWWTLRGPVAVDAGPIRSLVVLPLERGYRERDPLMILLRVDSRFDPLHSDPRFQDLVRRVGIPEG